MSVGYKERNLTCLFMNGTVTAAENCLDVIESQDVEVITICGMTPCEPVRYVTDPWGDCSCVTESRIRKVTCVDLNGKKVEEQMCEALEIRKPRSLEFCIPLRCDEA